MELDTPQAEHFQERCAALPKTVMQQVVDMVWSQKVLQQNSLGPGAHILKSAWS